MAAIAAKLQSLTILTSAEKAIPLGLLSIAEINRTHAQRPAFRQKQAHQSPGTQQIKD